MLTSTFDIRAKNNLHMRQNPVLKFRPVEHMTFAFSFESRDCFPGYRDYLHRGFLETKKVTCLPRPSFFLRHCLHTQNCPKALLQGRALGSWTQEWKWDLGGRAGSWQGKESQGREKGTIPVPLKEAEEKGGRGERKGVSIAEEL